LTNMMMINAASKTSVQNTFGATGTESSASGCIRKCGRSMPSVYPRPARVQHCTVDLQRHRLRLAVYAIGSLALAVFFFWSAVDSDSVPLWLAIAGVLGAVVTLVEAAAQLRRRKNNDP